MWCQKELLQKTGRFERTMNERKSHELYSKVERIENVSGQIVVLGLFVCLFFLAQIFKEQ